MSDKEEISKCGHDLSLRKDHVHDERDFTLPHVPYETTRMIIHRHDAKKAGLHFDHRILLDGKAVSWATKKALPGSSDEPRQFYQTPHHTKEYMNFQGFHPEGEYGHGETRIAWDAPVIARSRPGRVDLTITAAPYQGRYVLLEQPIGKKGERPWRVIKRKEIPKEWHPRNPFSNDVPDEAWTSPKWHASEKQDGVSVLATLSPQGVGIVSRRLAGGKAPVSKEDHVPWIRDLKIPPQYHGMVIQGELHHPTEPFNVVSGILASEPTTAVTTQNQLGTLRLAPWNVVKMPGGKPATDAPFSERWQVLENLSRELGSPHLKIPESTTASDKKGFFQKVVSRGGEGIVLTQTDAKGDIPQYRAKKSTDYTLKVVKVTEGTGSLQGRGVGALIVADQTGRIIGKVGTGLTLDQREDAWKNPKNWIGKLVKIEALEPTASALRHPRFKGFNADSAQADTVNLKGDQAIYERLKGLGVPEHEQKERVYKMKSAAGWRPKTAESTAAGIDDADNPPSIEEGERLVPVSGPKRKIPLPPHPWRTVDPVLGKEGQVLVDLHMHDWDTGFFPKTAQKVSKGPPEIGEEVLVQLEKGRGYSIVAMGHTVGHGTNPADKMAWDVILGDRSGGSGGRYRAKIIGVIRTPDKNDKWLATKDGKPLTEKELRSIKGYRAARSEFIQKPMQIEIPGTKDEQIKSASMAHCESCGYQTSDCDDIESLKQYLMDDGAEVNLRSPGFEAKCPDCQRKLVSV